MNVLRPDEVAKKLKISKKTAYLLIADGTIPAVRIGGQWRVSEESLDQLLNNSAALSSAEDGGKSGSEESRAIPA